MFIRDAWYVAAWGGDVGPEPFARRILGDPVVLFRLADGRVAALEDRCCHRGLPLSCGTVLDAGVRCGYHGLEFDAAGRCTRIPGQDAIPAGMRVRSFPVVERDGLVWLWTGDPSAADPGAIPAFPFHAGPDRWPHERHTRHIRCDWRLVIDNLMDLTHLAYVHTGTIGGDPDAHTTAKFTVEPTARGVRLQRWLLNSVPPATYVEAVGFTGRVDRWMEFEFVAPGAVLQFTGALPVGAGAYERGVREGGFALRIFHNVTPESADSCHYFWSGCHAFRRDDPMATRRLNAALEATFAEDVALLEIQHRSLRERPEPLHSTVHDAARVQAERAIAAMAARDGR